MKSFLFGLLSFWCFALYAQSITVNRTKLSIEIDGFPDDEAWKYADSAYNFMQFFPFDTSLAEYQTKVLMLHDDDYIYVAAYLYNISSSRKYVTPSLRRDFRGEANDGFSVVFDTFKDRTNAFIFGINPFGVLREGLITDGGSGGNSFSLDWDNKWHGAAKIMDGYWTCEMAIPLKTLRYKENQTEWLINFYRIDSEHAERSTWAPIPRNFLITNLASSRFMYWDEPTKKPGANISLIPYVSAGGSKNYERREPASRFLDGGFDMKYAVSPALNLDITFNPDFSQVEVDQQVTNLDRFEIFFPERRQFFLENADLFANFGTGGSRPFFTRRIGVAVDTATGQNFQNAIPVGLRLSGKLTNNSRIGVLSMQAAPERGNAQPGYNYSVLTFQQKLLARSNVSFIMVNKQTFENQENFSNRFNAYDRVIGTDFNLASANNRWNGRAFFHQNLKENQPDSAFSTGMFLTYSKPEISINLFSQMIGANYTPEVGFVRRRDIKQLAGSVNYFFYPKNGNVQSHGPGFDFDMVGNDTYGFLDYDYNFIYTVRFDSNARLSARFRKEYVYLFNSFDPSGTRSDAKLPALSDYHFNMFLISYESDQRKNFTYFLYGRTGAYFNGIRHNFRGVMSYRYQPYGATSIDISYNDIIMPAPYTSAKLYLIGPRFDFTFTRSLFWTTFVQYNSQIENLNINSRLQWRFKPVSDIFLVYTDNYFAFDDRGSLISFGSPRSRSLVFKLTYWFNV